MTAVRDWTNEVFTGKGAHVKPERSFSSVAAKYPEAANTTANNIAAYATLVRHPIEPPKFRGAF